MIIKILFCVFLGMLTVQGFAPGNHAYLLLLSYCLFFCCILQASPRFAFLNTFAYCCGALSVTLMPIAYTTGRLNGTNHLEWWGLLIGCAMAYALPCALMMCAFTYVSKTVILKNRTMAFMLFFPAVWTLGEVMRGQLFEYPYLLIGNSQISTPLGGFIPIFGVYGTSLIALTLCGAIVSIFFERSVNYRIALIVFSAGLLFSGELLRHVSWTEAQGRPIVVSVVQGDIQQDPSTMRQLLDDLSLYRELLFMHLSSKLIVWPENSISAPEEMVMPYINILGNVLKNDHSNLMLGTLWQSAGGKKTDPALLEIGDNAGIYYKKHLVPFAEYIPFSKILKPIFNYFKISSANFSSVGTPSSKSLYVLHFKVATFMCYEILFSNFVLTSAERSKLLVTIADDKWFGSKIVPIQHLQIAQMRSLETGRYQLFSANTGVSAIISPQGVILESAPLNTRMVISGTIRAMSGFTPLMRFHYYPLYVWLLMVFLFGLIRQFSVCFIAI